MQIFFVFVIELFIFLVFSFKHSLDVLDISLLLEILFAKSFFHPVDFFHFLDSIFSYIKGFNFDSFVSFIVCHLCH